MFRYLISCCLLLCLLYACPAPVKTPSALLSDKATLAKLAPQPDRIAFGSCNQQNRPQTIWPSILQNKPELWIWLGDNIYADTENMDTMRSMYVQQKSNKTYQAFLKNCPIIGIWDDHDYGVNDGDKHYPKKSASKSLMLDFLDVPPNAPVRQRKGAYQAHTFGQGNHKIKILLLDSRSFRDELVATASGKPRYHPNPDGDILGEAQWLWLEKELAESDAALHIIANGIQFIPEEHDFEKWANFPKARQRFFELIQKLKPAGLILLSGDRHIAEISRIELEGLGYPLYEITSSGLTHSYEKAGDEANRHRVSALIGQKNFGLMQINWNSEGPVVQIEIHGEDNVLYERQEINFKQ